MINPVALGTLVFETIDVPANSRTIKAKTLKSWGFDLIKGTIDGQASWFVSATEAHQAGDSYTEGSNAYTVDEIVNELSPKQQIEVAIELVEGTAYLAGILRDEDGVGHEIFMLPAALTLSAFLKKQRCEKLATTIRSVGTLTGIVTHKGEHGKPLTYDALPNEFKRFLKDARKQVAKKTGSSRIALACFGENKDRVPRYWLSWMLPTIDLLDSAIAKKVDQLLTELP